MKIFALLCCLLVSRFASAQTVPPENTAARACNAFGFKLLAETRKSLPAANVFQSPVGLAFALSMVGNGAEGETRNQIARALQLEGVAPAELNEGNKLLLDRLSALDPKIKLEIANGIWTDKNAKIKPAFLSSTEKSYRAEVSSADFQDPATVKNINHWVSQNTHGKIPEMVAAPLEPYLRLIVLDAIYFKGDWLDPFAKKLTQDKPFTLSSGQQVQHPRMTRSAKLGYFENAAFQAVVLPYAGGQVSMYVFLPKEGLDKFIQDLTPEHWEQWLRQFGARKGRLELPRFKLENRYDLNDELKALGMPRAFTSQAELGGISDERLMISWVKQKTFVEVNEEGTEAAAVSGIGISASAIMREPEPPFTMIVDKPFYVAIREIQTGTILFHGAILDPR
jgi:serpin B